MGKIEDVFSEILETTCRFHGLRNFERLSAFSWCVNGRYISVQRSDLDLPCGHLEPRGEYIVDLIKDKLKGLI